MDFFELIQNRHSVRAYTSQPVEPEKLQQILEAINRAPSAGNLQAYQVYIVRAAEQRLALALAAWDQQFIAQAPITLVFCTDPTRNEERYKNRGTSLYCLQDATIACTFAQLAVAALGLSTVWVGAFQEEQVCEILHLPEGLRPVAMLPIGYVDGEPHIRPRRELSDLVHEA